MSPPLLQPGQRRLAAPGALDVEDLRPERQLVARDLAYAERVEERAGVPVAVDEAQHLDGRLPAEGLAGVGVDVAHERGHVGRDELVEGEHALLQELADLRVVLLAAALLLGLARVAVVQADLELAALGALAEQLPDPVLVGELVAVVGEGGAHPPLEHPPGHDRPDVRDRPLHAAAVVRPHQQRELHVAGQVVEREDRLRVDGPPDDAVELGAGALALARKPLELAVAALGGVRGRLARGLPVARLAADLALEL